MLVQFLLARKNSASTARDSFADHDASQSSAVSTFSPPRRHPVLVNTPRRQRQHGGTPCLRPQRKQGMSRRVALVGLSAAVAIGAILLHRYRRSRVSRGSRFDAIIRDPVAAFLRSYDLKTLSATEFMEVVQSGLQTPASLARALAFVPRPGDVVTLTTPKTGTP